LAGNKGRGWKLLVIPEDESHVREFRLPRKAVLTFISAIALLIIYAGVETVLFWAVAHRAAEVEPLRRKVRELENSGDQLTKMGAELTKLRSFEQQLRRALTGKDASGLESLPWGNTTYEDLPKGEDANQQVVPPKPTASPVGEARSISPLAYTAMDVPTYPPVRGYVTRRFLSPASLHSISHRGLDIAAREGTPIMAAADGLVLFSDWTYRYGNLVVVSHRSGYVSFYGHNQALLVRAGERVRQGEPIALLGNSGASSAPHLHFELWMDGSPVDPLTLLRVAP
jgi:murein DD-endopeptidase MepM/ murein hydrolase activator NlpD